MYRFNKFKKKKSRNKIHKNTRTSQNNNLIKFQGKKTKIVSCDRKRTDILCQIWNKINKLQSLSLFLERGSGGGKCLLFNHIRDLTLFCLLNSPFHLHLIQ